MGAAGTWVRSNLSRLSAAPDRGWARRGILLVLPGVPLGTNSVKNRKKLSQAGTVLPVSELIIYRSPGQTPFPQRIWKL